MHFAALSPIAIDKEDLDQNILIKEKEIKKIPKKIAKSFFSKVKSLTSKKEK